MVRIRQQFRAAAVGALFALSLLAVTGVTARAQWRDDPYYGRSGKDQRKSEKKAEKRRRKEEKEWEKRERKEEKEERKARDRRDGDDDYDDDYEYDRDGRDNRDRDYDNGRGAYEELRREAYERGAREGLRAGEGDRSNGRGRDYDRHRTYRDANAGYSDRYGDRGQYQESFREGFRRGYDEGYDRGSTNRRTDTGWGRILGDIIGRP